MFSVLAAQAACSDSSDDNAADAGPSDAARVEAAHVVIPFVISLQGTLQTDGQEQRRGALVAAQQLNSLGGILGKQVEIEFLDDNSDPGVAASYATGRLAQLASPVVLGPTGSPSAASLRAAAPSTLFLSPSATSPVLDLSADAGATAESLFFRTIPSDTLLAKGLALLANSGEQNVDQGVAGCLSLSIIYSDDDYGKPIAESVARQFINFSNKVTAVTPMPATLQAPDRYTDLANTVVPAEKNCQLVIASAEIGANYIRQFVANEANVAGVDWTKFQTFGSNAMRTDAFLKDSLVDPADPSKGSIANGTALLDAETQGDVNSYSAFKTMYDAMFTEPVGRSANTYDAVILAALALEAAGAGADSEKVRAALLNVSKLGEAKNPKAIDSALQSIRAGKDIDYVGASGSLDFDAKGQILTDYLVWRVREGAFQNTSRYTRSAVQ